MAQLIFLAAVLTTLVSATGATSWLHKANLRSQEEMTIPAEGYKMKEYIETLNDVNFLTFGENSNGLTRRIEGALHWGNGVCQDRCIANIEAIKSEANDQNTKNMIDIHRQRCM